MIYDNIMCDVVGLLSLSVKNTRLRKFVALHPRLCRLVSPSKHIDKSLLVYGKWFVVLLGLNGE